jgi:hypothetical protein
LCERRAERHVKLDRYNISVLSNRNVVLSGMNSDQARRFLARKGCTFEKGKGGHLLVRRDARTSVLPVCGSRS